MKLKSILKTLPADHLRQIEERWEIAPADIEELETEEQIQDRLIANLYQRMQTRSAWEIGTRGLTEEERGLIHFLTIHGGDLERSEVGRRYFEGDFDRMDDVVEALADRGIVFYDAVPGLSDELTLVGVPEPFLRFIDLPAFWEGYLGHFLKELSNNELKHIATQGLRLQPESANKNYLIHLIRTNLLDPKFLRRYLERLQEGQRSVFDSLVERKGVGVYRDLLELNVQRRYDHSRSDALQWLLGTSGLVFTAVPGGNKYNNLLMIPRDIMFVVTNHFQEDRRTFRQLDSISVVEKEQKPALILDNSTTFMRDLVVFANFIDRHPVRVLTSGGIGRNDLKKVLPLLSKNKPLKYAEFLSLFLIEKKFLLSTGETFRIAPTFITWLRDSQRAYQEILNWWLSTSNWNEEFIEGNVAHAEPAPTGLVSIVPFRKLVLEVLADMPRDRWCVEEGFYEEVLPKVAQDIPRRGDTFVYDKHTRSNDLVLESIVAESLSWLGVLAVGLTGPKDVELLGTRVGDGKTLKARGGSRGRPRKQRGVRYNFRFTDLGRFLFSRPMEQWATAFIREHADDVIPMNFDVESFFVQGTNEVIVPPDLALPIFYRLNEFTHARSIDVMSIMAISTTSIREGLDLGLTGQEIEAFLETHSRTPLPDTLRHLIKESSQKHGEVNMAYAGGYIVVDDPMLLGQIRHGKKFAPLIKTVLDEHVVLLHPDVDLKKMSRELQKIGFMPRLESEHVQLRDDERYNISLDREDMVRLIAAVRFALKAVDEKGREVAYDRLAPLLERLKADPRSFAALEDLADPLVSTWTRAVEGATESRIAGVRREYESQISHLVTTSVPRGTSKYNFEGPNPATAMTDIRRMIDFAIDHEFEVEIDYVKANQDEVTEVIAPESLERDRIYAHCRSRDAYAVYRVDRIHKAKLV